MKTPMADALTTWFTEGTPIPQGVDFHQDLDNVVHLAGGQRAAARLLGVAESSLRRWRSGVTPRRLVDLVRPVRRLFAGRQRFVDAYNGYNAMVVDATVVYSNDKRRRRLHVGREISPRRMQAILRAWEDGNDTTVQRNLSRAIKEDYFRIESEDVGLGMVQLRTVHGIAFE